MDAKEQEFLKRLREIFRLEADEHIRTLSSGLIELEKTSETTQCARIVETIFREAHSFKGAARSVNLKEIETLCQSLESVFSTLKRNEIPLSAALFDLFHQTIDMLTGLVQNMDAERTSADRVRLRDLTRRLTESAQAAPAQPVVVTAAAKAESQPEKLEIPFQPPLSPEVISTKENPVVSFSIPETVLTETVRIPISKLDPLLLQAEEMIQAKLAAAQRASELRDIQQELLLWKTETTKSKNQLIDSLDMTRIDSLTGKIDAVRQSFEQDQRALRHMVDDHLEAMKQVLMLPGSSLVEGFPRLVRNLARAQGKEIDLLIRGAEIEMDKRILEELKDPLIHLLRNSIDHGIEKPEARASQHKPVRGVINITFTTKNSRQVEILIADDGAGIDVEQVRKAAVKSGLIPAETAANLNVQETLALIFQSGFSTSEIITDISGRGLGLAIVREKAEKLGGQVTVESRPGQGTTFCLQVPLTLATFRGVLVRARQQLFILPTMHVERALRVDLNEVQTIENRETIRMDGRILSMVRLGDVLGLPLRKNELNRQESADEHVSVLILSSSQKRIALQVDEVLAEEEVLVKGLGKQLSRVLNISGATVLGAGKVVPVINVADLMNSALRPDAAFGAPVIAAATAQVSRVLVAEDSITARSLLKGILEAGGYHVTTAVDGMDAFTQLHGAEFDLVVSDVDMPRLSGFELTTKIRADKQLSEIPVVLVTALESRQDRERGIEVGANGYIVKSSFDQSNLLEVVRRLL